MSLSILVTGGAGYIGSHTCLVLQQAGFDVVVIDNLSNSSLESLKRVESITGKPITFYEMDLLDEDRLDKVFKTNRIDAVIHFAGLKAVGESVTIPLKYYENNISGTLSLLKVMQKNEVRRIVFSSSATVYGMNNVSPLKEEMPLSATNPYGRTKLMIEEILQDVYNSEPGWHISRLRYFNPIGAHESGLIGEDPNGVPNNLMPYVTQVAIGRLAELQIYGSDYETHDGTGVRDYIHVMDLAEGHVKAIGKVLSKEDDISTYNLGTGIGVSVLDLIRTYEAVNGTPIPYRITGRRPGDIGTCYADASKAFEELNWKTNRSLEDMCRDSWKWQKMNPSGFKE